MTTASLSALAPAVLVHLVFAVSALALTPIALAARKGSRLHRSAGHAWVTLTLGAALSSLFIRDFNLPNFAGYTAIHLLTLATFAGIGRGLWLVSQRNIAGHRLAMQMTCAGSLIAGLFALAPSRFLGGMI